MQKVSLSRNKGIVHIFAILAVLVIAAVVLVGFNQFGGNHLASPSCTTEAEFNQMLSNQSSLQSGIYDIEAQIRTNNDGIVSLQGSLVRLNTDINKVVSLILSDYQIEELRKQVDEGTLPNSEYVEIVRQNEMNKEQRDKLYQEKSNLELQISATDNTAAALNDSLITLQSDLNNLNTSITSAQNNICTISEVGLCTDQKDNDGDGVGDCSDSDCSNDTACQTTCPKTELDADGNCSPDYHPMYPACADQTDNDTDGSIDCADMDCSSDPACLPVTCNPACNSGEVCVNGSCQISGCNPACTGTQTCVNGSCQNPPPECTTDADCGTGKICSNGSCIDGGKCKSDTDCPSGQTCNVGSGECEVKSAVCGNGKVEGDEECDDGNATNNDGCSSVCLKEELYCGDGICTENESSQSCPEDCPKVCDYNKPKPGPDHCAGLYWVTYVMKTDDDKDCYWAEEKTCSTFCAENVHQSGACLSTTSGYNWSFSLASCEFNKNSFNCGDTGDDTECVLNTGTTDPYLTATCQ